MFFFPSGSNFFSSFSLFLQEASPSYILGNFKLFPAISHLRPHHSPLDSPPLFLSISTEISISNAIMMTWDNMLPTGWAGVLIEAVTAYSCLCIYYNRTPLWPKRKLTSPRLGLVICCVSCLTSFVGFVIGNAVLTDPPGLKINAWYITTLLLYPISAGFYGPMLVTGFLGYILGLEGPLRSNPDGDAKSTAPSSDTESEFKSMDIDTEGGKGTNAKERRLQRNRSKGTLCFWIFLMGTYAALLNTTLSWLILQERGSSASPVTWFETCSYLLLVLLSALCFGGMRYAFEMNPKINGLDLILRFLAFFGFFVVVVSHICAQAMLAATSNTMLGGIPDYHDWYEGAARGSCAFTVLFVLISWCSLSAY